MKKKFFIKVLLHSDYGDYGTHCDFVCARVYVSVSVLLQIVASKEIIWRFIAYFMYVTLNNSRVFRVSQTLLFSKVVRGYKHYFKAIPCITFKEYELNK